MQKRNEKKLILYIKSAGLILLLTSIILYTVNCSEKAIIPPIEEVTEEVESKKENQFIHFHSILNIPKDWNLLFEKEDKAIATFANQDRTIKGKLNVYQNNSKKDFNKLFQEYLQEKGDIRFLWMSPVEEGKQKGWMATGFIERTKNIFDNKKEYYTVYLALFPFEKHFYELILLGNGKELDFETEALQIIYNLELRKNSLKTSWKSFGIRIPKLTNWIPQSSRGKEIISWTHKSLPIIMTLSLVKKIKSSKEVSKEVKKEIDLFRINLLKLNYKYDFEIQLARVISKKKKKAIVFHAVGLRDKKKIGVRKYYFSGKNYLYEVLVWYETKDWKQGIGKEVDKVLSSIELTQ